MIPAITVDEKADGVWSAMERGPSRVAIAYFPSKWSALKHAVRVAVHYGRRVEVKNRRGEITCARDYERRES